MVFLIRDNYILAHGTKWDDDDIIKMFRDEAERLLAASCPSCKEHIATWAEKSDTFMYLGRQ